jgi:hypothetical protein
MWLDRLGQRRHDDEDYDSVEADIKRRYAPEPLVYCTKCHLPIAAKRGITQHKVCPETTSNQDGR